MNAGSPSHDRAPDQSPQPSAPPEEETHYTLMTPQHWEQQVVDQLSPTLSSASPSADTPATRKRKKSARGDWWVFMGFNLLVFLSSICVMTLELTASRLIAKHVGSSLYTWTSVIGVVLAGITMGNYLGGWLADRYSRPRALAWMYLLSSFSCASVLWLDRVVGEMDRPQQLSWPAWVLCVVTAMFLIPALTLGTTSPLVASMALTRSTRVGLTVGNVYAWGALGSIVGTFLTGFYLIDQWGTRTIIGMTSAVLAMLAIVVAAGRWAFRVGVVLGWMQTLGWLLLLATVHEALGKSCGTVLASSLGLWLPGDVALRDLRWQRQGSQIARKLHDLGLLLQLRDDPPDVYVDESSYSYIRVDDDYSEGNRVRYLRLDKLIHSYYEPDNPTALHYEYEQVYAAVTRLVLQQQNANPAGLQITVPPFPGDQELLSHLPAGVSFEPTQRQLQLPHADTELLDALLRLSPQADYWSAVLELYQTTTSPNWGGFSSVCITHWPEGLTLPQEYLGKLHYDSQAEALSAYQPVTRAMRDWLLQQGPHAAWYQTIATLRHQVASRTALFLGGGGYIFPRWLVARCPEFSHIDVAELDPAVYQAVKSELGLTEADEEFIHTTLGDARNFVEDRYQDNKRRLQRGLPPRLYDFIYGDAFNDFSVPFHLTTIEFHEMLRSLLTPTGVLQQNVIEIYPRTEVPEGSVGTAEVEYAAALPPPVAVPRRHSDWQPLAKAHPLEYLPAAQSQIARLRTPRELTTADEQRLLALAPDDSDWVRAVQELARASREKQVLPCPLPVALTPVDDWELTWNSAPDPFAGIEVYRVGQGGYVLGIRGGLTDQRLQQLHNLLPDNAAWKQLLTQAFQRTQRVKPGRFLARYVYTMTHIYPCVYVFSTSIGIPSADRDTYVVVCAQQPLTFEQIAQTGLWTAQPFAGYERREPMGAKPHLLGQMEHLLALSGNIVLSDDYAPVDNLLQPVFTQQD